MSFDIFHEYKQDVMIMKKHVHITLHYLTLTHWITANFIVLASYTLNRNRSEMPIDLRTSDTSMEMRASDISMDFKASDISMDFRCSDNSKSSALPLHRRRILYLVRHGQAIHNVLEKEAQEKARIECKEKGLSEAETEIIVDEARQAVLNNKALLDAPLTQLGRDQAHETGKILRKIIDDNEQHSHIPKPTEAMVSPLSRCLETADIILKYINVKDDNNFTRACIRPELRERKTSYPPDTPNFKTLKSGLLQEYNATTYTIDKISLEDDDTEQEKETRAMLRERVSKLFHLIIDTKSDTNILIISHKGYLREFERGLLGIDDSPLFDNAELRIYNVTFTRGDRVLDSVERLY